jgi:hypothetical protein
MARLRSPAPRRLPRPDYLWPTANLDPERHTVSPTLGHARRLAMLTRHPAPLQAIRLRDASSRLDTTRTICVRARLPGHDAHRPGATVVPRQWIRIAMTFNPA